MVQPAPPVALVDRMDRLSGAQTLSFCGAHQCAPRSWWRATEVVANCWRRSTEARAELFVRDLRKRNPGPLKVSLCRRVAEEGPSLCCDSTLNMWADVGTHPNGETINGIWGTVCGALRRLWHMIRIIKVIASGILRILPIVTLRMISRQTMGIVTTVTGWGNYSKRDSICENEQHCWRSDRSDQRSCGRRRGQWLLECVFFRGGRTNNEEFWPDTELISFSAHSLSAYSNKPTNGNIDLKLHSIQINIHTKITNYGPE